VQLQVPELALTCDVAKREPFVPHSIFQKDTLSLCQALKFYMRTRKHRVDWNSLEVWLFASLVGAVKLG
jgi:hypothetical protein